MAQRTTAVEIYARMAWGKASIELAAAQMEKVFNSQILEQLEDLTNEKMCKDWRPKDPNAKPKGDRVHIQNHPSFSAPYSGSSGKLPRS